MNHQLFVKGTLTLLSVALLFLLGCKKKEAAAPVPDSNAAGAVQPEKNAATIEKTAGNLKPSTAPAMQRVSGTTNKIPMVP